METIPNFSIGTPNLTLKSATASVPRKKRTRIIIQLSRNIIVYIIIDLKKKEFDQIWKKEYLFFKKFHYEKLSFWTDLNLTLYYFK